MNYYDEIKTTLLKNREYKKIKDYSKNKSDLNSYFEVGKLIVETQGGKERAKYGNQLIKEYSEKLTNELGKGYSTRNLKYMRKFYLFIQKGQTMSAQLSWSHYVELLKLNSIDEINYYIYIKEPFNDKTIGVVICKRDNKFVMEYCTDPRIFVTTYELEKS